MGLGWQRYFLDAYIGFWESTGKFVDECEEGHDRMVDYGAIYKLHNKKIRSAKCVNGEIDLIIEGVGSLILKLVNPSTDDTSSKLFFNEAIT